MELSDDEIKIQEEAKKFIKDHKKELIDKFILQKNPLRQSLFAFFMAGSPGAGKTEFTKRYFVKYPFFRQALSSCFLLNC
jgi:hypothetical protein